MPFTDYRTQKCSGRRLLSG